MSLSNQITILVRDGDATVELKASRVSPYTAFLYRTECGRLFTHKKNVGQVPDMSPCWVEITPVTDKTPKIFESDRK